MSKTLKTILIVFAALALIGVGYIVARAVGGGQAEDKQVPFSVTVNQAADFGLSISPASLTLTKGEVGYFTVTTSVVGGYTGDLDLTLAGLPAGSYTFTANPVAAGSTSTLAVNTASLAVQTYSCTLTAAEVAEQLPFSLPADRVIDWSYAGIPGGIPTRTTVYTALSPGATTSQINTALTNCPSGQVVYLNAGTYSLTGTLVLKSNKTLRGAGAGKTILNIPKVANPDVGNSAYYSIASGYTKGSTNITMAATPTGFTVGAIITILQNDDTSFIMTTGSPGQNLNTLHRVTGKSGNVLTIEPPLPHGLTASLNPKASYISPTGLTLAGLESMTLNATGSGDFIEFWSADRCWLKDCEVYNARNAFTFWVWCIQCEVRRCYFHHAYGAPNNSDGYPVYFHSVTSHCLAVDNIAHETWGSILMTGSSANAALYNYTWNTVAQGLDSQVDALNCNHGAHGLMSLWEGNVAEQFMNDAYHGTGSHQTLFRNWINGLHPTKTANRIMANLNRGSYYHNLVGNVFGDSSWNPTAYEMSGNASEDNGYIYRLGYPNMGSNSLSQETDFPLLSNTYPDNRVKSTLLRHGNYDYYNRAVVWDAASSERTLPASLYYKSKPAWFGSLDWPPIGPDVTGYARPIPAQARWNAYVASGNLGDLF